MLRGYQQSAFDAVIDHLKTGSNNCLIEAATGAGKSHIIAALADFIYQRSGNQTICIAPSAELVMQNHEKYLLTGNNASIYSASAGSKCLRYKVTFATPTTLKNNLSKFKNKISAVIIDEAHGITPTIRSIVETIQESNEKLKVIGLTATPYRTKTGYIFNLWPDNKQNSLDQSIDTYFEKLVYRITAPELIDMGFLSPPVFTESAGYDTKDLDLNSTGNFKPEQVEKAFEGKGRLTSDIISQIVEYSQNRKGVLIFCATVRHAQEALSSLPRDNSAIVTGETKKPDRDKILTSFKQQKIKYIVNVAVLTTGFDAPHVDVVAILRATESVSLYQQIAGRGLRIAPGKKDCLILDYAQNLERHCPSDGDIFDMDIKVRIKKETGKRIDVKCPSCDSVNEFVFNQEYDKAKFNGYGKMIDLAGIEITDDYGDPIHVHFGRRCQFLLDDMKTQCFQRFNAKACPKCDHDNDMTARYCSKCKYELIDPNKKLEIEFKKYKKSPYNKQVDQVIDYDLSLAISKTGNDTLKIKWTTAYRSFVTWHSPLYKSKWTSLFGEINIRNVINYISNYVIESVTYKKNKSSGFYEVYAFNEDIDQL